MTTTTEQPAATDGPHLDIEQERTALHKALAHIESLRHQQPYSTADPVHLTVHDPVPAPTVDTFRDQQVGNPNTKTNTNQTPHAPENATRPREMAA